MLPFITLFTGKKGNGLPSGLPAQGANLANAKLVRLNLKGEKLPMADFHQADLRGTNLQGAELEQAYFVDANLSGANLSEANLKGANFRGANLEQVNFNNAKLTRALFDSDTKLPFSRSEAEERGMRFDNERTDLP